MPATTSLSAQLRTMTALYAGNRNPLRFGNAYTTSFKDYHNHLIGQNILSKAAQLVNDLDSARHVEENFQNFLAEKQSTLKTSLSARGGFLDISR